MLSYNRIARNRRRTWLLVAFAILTLAPFVVGISYGVATGIAGRLSPQARDSRAWIASQQAFLKRTTGDPRTAWHERIEQEIETRRAGLAALDAENLSLKLKLMTVTALGLAAALGILFWGIASSPTSKLLTQSGARPADEGEAEARLLLENLASAAGLPFPKLYVIESSVPNAFAAGVDPEHAIIAVTRGALSLFDRREFEGVLAHELSHIGNHDIRLNTIAASVALFLRIPYLMFRRGLASESPAAGGKLALWRLAVSPFGIYLLFVTPFLGAIIRAVVSRKCEFLADADAVLLTKSPDGLLRALSKIGGAGSALGRANPSFAHFYLANPIAAGTGWLNGSGFATHPPLAERIERLAAQGDGGLAGVEQAIELGRKYLRDRAGMGLDHSFTPGAADQLAAFNQGNVMGRVYRVLSADPVPVYETQIPNACKLAMVTPGSLIVVFDDPGRMRQVNTAEQTFGYIERNVKLAAVDHMIPAEVYDPRLRIAAEMRLGAVATVQASPEKRPLTIRQMAVVLGFGALVFAGTMLLMMRFG